MRLELVDSGTQLGQQIWKRKKRRTPTAPWASLALAQKNGGYRTLARTFMAYRAYGLTKIKVLVKGPSVNLHLRI